MPGIFKKLNAQDVKITPFEAHKQYSTTTLSSIDASVNFIDWAPYNKFYYTKDNIKYYQLDKLYYRNYISERAHRLELDDATYTTQERRLYGYANVISLSQKTFGSEVQPGSFEISCSYSSSGEQFNIKDDSFGNLYDVNLGNTNFPNEDNRMFYLGPVLGYKVKDLTVDYNTGNKYINEEPLKGLNRTVFDDSYFLNKIIYKSIEFVSSSSNYKISGSEGNISGLPGFTSFRTITETSSIKIPHKEQLNFNKDEPFTITFHYQVNEKDLANCTGSNDHYLFSKEGTKTVPYIPSETTQHSSLDSPDYGSLTTAPVGPQFPYRVFYRGNHPSANTSSLFFERSDGDKIHSMSVPFFTSNSLEKNESKFVSIQVGGVDESYTSVINVRKDISGNIIKTNLTQDINKHVSNQADIYFYRKSNPDGTFTNNIGTGAGQMSQFMVWNKFLSSEELVNVSQSITGTPNIGNIFYDNGFATITHPKYEDLLRKYDINSAQLANELDISSTSGDATDLQFNNDGTKLFITAHPHESASNVSEYKLSTPFDISTAGFIKNYGSGSVPKNPNCITFNNDGTKAYVGDRSVPLVESRIREFDLSSSYDFGTRTLVSSSILTLSSNRNASGIQFNNDGTKFFIADTAHGMVHQFKTSQPFSLYNLKADTDLSSSALGTIHTSNNQGPHGLAFSEDGYKLFLVGRNSSLASRLDYFKLREPFEVSTATFISCLVLQNAPESIGNPHGVTFNNTHDKLYIADTTNLKIAEYNLPGDINTFKYKNTHLITENEYQCTMKENEFEYTTNISARDIPSISNNKVANFVTGSNFKPYVTTIGLYDDNGNLLVVGKLAQPVRASSETDTTFVIRYDT